MIPALACFDLTGSNAGCFTGYLAIVHCTLGFDLCTSDSPHALSTTRSYKPLWQQIVHISKCLTRSGL